MSTNASIRDRVEDNGTVSVSLGLASVAMAFRSGMRFLEGFSNESLESLR